MNLNRFLLSVIYLISAVLLTGCVTLYKPNITHSPMLTEKGQGHVSTAIGVTGCGLANIQADYAISKHVGIMANGMYHYRSNNVYLDTLLGTEKLNIFCGEAGFGVFDKIGNSNLLFMNCYAGGGYGKSEAKIDPGSNPPRINAEFYDFFIQPGFIFTKRYIDMAVDMRFKYVKMYNIESFNYMAFDWWENNVNLLSQPKLDFVLFEPSFTFSGGGEHLRGVLQAGLVIPIVNSESYFGTSSFAFFDAPVFKFSVGFCYAFGKKKEK